MNAAHDLPDPIDDSPEIDGLSGARDLVVSQGEHLIRALLDAKGLSPGRRFHLASKAAKAVVVMIAEIGEPMPDDEDLDGEEDMMEGFAAHHFPGGRRHGRGPRRGRPPHGPDYEDAGGMMARMGHAGEAQALAFLLQARGEARRQKDRAAEAAIQVRLDAALGIDPERREEQNADQLAQPETPQDDPAPAQRVVQATERLRASRRRSRRNDATPQPVPE